MEVLKPLSSTTTSLLASKWEASHRQRPLTYSSRSWAIFDFLIDQPPSGRRAIPLPTVETVSPNSSSKASRCSSRVRSWLASRCFGSQRWSIIPFLEGLPGIGLGSTSPVSRRLLSQRFIVGTDTEGEGLCDLLPGCT